MRSIKEVLHDIILDISAAEVDSNLLLSRIERDELKNKDKLTIRVNSLIKRIDDTKDLLQELNYKIDCID